MTDSFREPYYAQPAFDPQPAFHPQSHFHPQPSFDPQGFEPGPPKRNRRALLLALSATGAIVLIVAIVWAVSVFVIGPDDANTPQTGGKTPQEAVQLYLDALSRGEADKALALGVEQPPSREFLTSEILKKQIAGSPISAVQVLRSTPSGQPDVENVEVSANFGNVSSRGTLAVRKTSGGWKLSHAAIALQPSTPKEGGRSLEFLSLFGKPAGKQTSIYVFPGALEVGSLNKHITLASGQQELLAQLGQGMDPNWMITSDLSQEGHDAVIQAMQDKLDSCEQSDQLAPPGCPNKLNNPSAADGTVQWNETEDYQDQDPDVAVDFAKMTASVRVTLHWTFAVQLTNGGKGNGQFPDEPRDFQGTADLTQDKLEVTF